VNGKMGLKLLAIAGYVGELAEDGEAALENIMDHGADYDVVLMDCQVCPDMACCLLSDARDGWIRMHSTDTAVGAEWSIAGLSTDYCSYC
jgi:DNA-binding response OmpR family regulator